MELLGVPTSFVKLGLRLSVVSDYLHVTGTIPCSPGLEDLGALPFTCLNGKPALFGSSVKGAVRSRADLLVTELKSSRALAGGRLGKVPCPEIALDEADWRTLKRKKKFRFVCCSSNAVGFDRASWRHLTIWFEEVINCKNPPHDEDLDSVFGIDKPVKKGKRTVTEMVPARAQFSTFFTDSDVEVIEVRLGGSRTKLEAVPKDTVFEGSVTVFNPDKKSLALLAYSLGLFKREPRILLGRFKYKKVPLAGGTRATFGHLRVELTSVTTLGFKGVPEDPKEFVEVMKNEFEKYFSEIPDFDEFTRLRRVGA